MWAGEAGRSHGLPESELRELTSGWTPPSWESPHHSHHQTLRIRAARLETQLLDICWHPGPTAQGLLNMQCRDHCTPPPKAVKSNSKDKAEELAFLCGPDETLDRYCYGLNVGVSSKIHVGT